MANELTIENAQYEQLIKSNSAKALATELKLTDAQIAKANTALLNLITNDKLYGVSQISKMRFAYRVATLNYKNPNAIAPVKYGKDVQAQLQYQAYIEDALACGGVEEINALPLFKDVDYKPHVNKLGFTELELPQSIKLDNPFEKKEVIGYYAYAKCVDGRVCTAVMSNQELDDWAQRYSISQKAFIEGSAKSSIWNSDKEAMCLKTVIKKVARQVLKWFPFDRLSTSLELDQAVFTERGVEYLDNPNNQQKVIDQKPTNNIVIDTGEEKKGE